jgi:hypothetical protein
MPLEKNGVAEFLCLADEFDALAAAARTQEAKQGLERLATRFRVFAAQYAAKGRSGRSSVDLETSRTEWRNSVGGS